MPQLFTPHLEEVRVTNLGGNEVFLRQVAAGDADTLYRVVAADVSHLGEFFDWPYGFTPDKACENVIAALEEIENGDGMWAHIMHGNRRDASIIGSTALSGRDKEAQTAELSYWVIREYEGGGAASNAARAMRDWGFREWGLRSITLGIIPGNVRSQRVAERLGAVLTDKVAFHGKPLIKHQVWVIDRESHELGNE